jgi:hypothetical protein
LDGGGQIERGQRSQRHLHPGLEAVGSRIEVVREVGAAKLAALVELEIGSACVDDHRRLRTHQQACAGCDRVLRPRRAHVDFRVQPLFG